MQVNIQIFTMYHRKLNRMLVLVIADVGTERVFSIDEEKESPQESECRER